MKKRRVLVVDDEPGIRQSLCGVLEDEGIMGAITGRAIYEGTLDFAAAQARADELEGARE